MNYETHESQRGPLSRLIREGPPIASASDFLDVLLNSPGSTLVLAKEDLHPDFFELKTGLAGEFLQKVSNYRRRLVILGDFERLDSKSLGDFVRESNGTGQVVFAPTLEKAVEYLR